MASSNRLLLFRPKADIFSSKSFLARMSLCFLVVYSVCDKLPSSCKSSRRSSFVSISTSSFLVFWAKELSAWAILMFEFCLFRFALIRHHFLNGIKKFLCDNRFVLSVIQFAVIFNHSVINFVFQHILII